MNGLWADCQDFVTRNLSEHYIAYLFVDGIPSASALGIIVSRCSLLGALPGPEPRSCGGAFLTSLVSGKSWLDKRLGSRRVPLKWYANPDAGYPSIIALGASIVPMHAPQWKRYLASFVRGTDSSSG